MITKIVERDAAIIAKGRTQFYLTIRQRDRVFMSEQSTKGDRVVDLFQCTPNYCGTKPTIFGISKTKYFSRAFVFNQLFYQ